MAENAHGHCAYLVEIKYEDIQNAKKRYIQSRFFFALLRVLSAFAFKLFNTIAQYPCNFSGKSAWKAA
jgi:hypothetical protein